MARGKRIHPMKDIGSKLGRRVFAWAGCAALTRPGGYPVLCCPNRISPVLTAEIEIPEASVGATFDLGLSIYGYWWGQHIGIDGTYYLIYITCYDTSTGPEWDANLVVCCSSGPPPPPDPPSPPMGNIGAGPPGDIDDETDTCDVYTTRDHFDGVNCGPPFSFGWTIPPDNSRSCYPLANINVTVTEKPLAEIGSGSGVIRRKMIKILPDEKAGRKVAVTAECFNVRENWGTGSVGPDRYIAGQGSGPTRWRDWTSYGRFFMKRTRPLAYKTGFGSGSGPKTREVWVRTCCVESDEHFPGGLGSGVGSGVGSGPIPSDVVVTCCPGTGSGPFVFPGRLYATFIAETPPDPTLWPATFTVPVDFDPRFSYPPRIVENGTTYCPISYSNIVKNDLGHDCMVGVAFCSGYCGAEEEGVWRGWWQVSIICNGIWNGIPMSCGIGPSFDFTTNPDEGMRKFLCQRPVYAVIGMCPGGAFNINIPPQPGFPGGPPGNPGRPYPCPELLGTDDWPGVALSGNTGLYQQGFPNPCNERQLWGVIIEE